MYGILGEYTSDCDMLDVLIRRLHERDNKPWKRPLKKKFDGGGGLLAKGSGQLRNFERQGCTHFIVCHDADGPDPSVKRGEVMRRVISPSGIADGYCITIPVQEIEAWILADIESVSNVYTGWRPPPIQNPESIANPKERLKRESRSSNKKPRYTTSTNPLIAEHLNLDMLRSKCPSFKILAEFVIRT